MTKKEEMIMREILMKNLSSERTDVDRKKTNDADNFKLWRRVYPDTYKNVLRAMFEYAELKVGGKNKISNNN